MRNLIYTTKEKIANVIETKQPIWEGVYRKELGWIAFVWGNTKKGICHILKRRDEQHAAYPEHYPDGLDTLDSIAEALVIGRVQKRESGHRADIFHGDFQAIIEEQLHGRLNEKLWLFNGFKRQSQPIKKAPDTKPKGKPRDLATHLEGSEVSRPSGSRGTLNNKRTQKNSKRRAI